MEWIRRVLRRIFNREKRNKVVILVDLENLLLGTENVTSPEKEGFSIEEGLTTLVKRIAQEVGEVVDVFVFTPPHLSNLYGKPLHQQGFFIIFCPKVLNKERQEIDTVDSTLINFGRRIIADTEGLTHICIGSGDRDFSPLARAAYYKGLRTIVIAGSVKSLSSELLKLAEKTYVFSPTQSQTHASQ